VLLPGEGAGAALRRRTSRRGFCPPPGQKVTCNAPPGPPPTKTAPCECRTPGPPKAPHRECRLPAGMAHVLERSSRAPPAGVWGEAAHRHAREAPPGPIAKARAAIIPRLHLAALRARPSASPARSRQEPSRGSRRPTRGGAIGQRDSVASFAFPQIRQGGRVLRFCDLAFWLLERRTSDRRYVMAKKPTESRRDSRAYAQSKLAQIM
jgi:hypothetical protein